VTDPRWEGPGAPIERILAATDGSQYGEHAAAVGYALAQRADGEFARLSVETGDDATGPVPDWVAGSTAEGGILSRIRGLPGVEIVRHAESWGADLVVLGRHGCSPDRPRLLGRTADAVIRRRSSLTLFVPPEVQTIRHATIALDGSLRGLGVLAPAAAFLNFTDARAGAICVLPGTRDEGNDGTGWRDPRSERACALVERLQLDSGPCPLLVRWGAPVPEILKTIRETDSNLLVLGVRRGGQRGDSGSGYVGRELLKSAPCAVLTVPI
jgi:nucleotide-binding universal stress UspA family protein